MPVPVPAVEYGIVLVPLTDGSELDVAPVAVGALPDGKIPVILVEIEGAAERLKLYTGAVLDSGGTVVALVETEGIADGSYEADVPMVPTTELAEYEYGLKEDEIGYGPFVG